jgi:hypothetical protein
MEERFDPDSPTSQVVQTGSNHSIQRTRRNVAAVEMGVKASIDGLGPGSPPPLNLSMRWFWEQMLLAPANAKTFK